MILISTFSFSWFVLVLSSTWY